ncbi:flagellar hook-length control protein FliK [bacterium]|nr:flagellar hook-length control protein FliK [bacterium]
MPIRLDTSSRTLSLSFASEKDRAAFFRSLREGQTVQARVVDQAPDGRWVLRIRGQDLLTESRLPLAKGQVVSARVETLGPPVVLSLLDGEAAGEEALSRALRDLGLDDDPAGRAVLGRMIARQLPLNGPAVQGIRDALVRMGLDLSDAERINRAVDAMFLLASRSVPITPASLEAALTAFSPSTLGGMIGNLLDLIRGLSPGLRSPAEANLRALEETLSALLMSAEGLDAGDLRRLIDDLGLGLEGKLRALTERPPDSQDLQRLSQTDLKAALLRLRAALNDPARIGADDTALLETLRGRADEALRHLEHLQLLNLPAQRDPAPHLLLQIPLLFGQERTSADLRVFYAEKEGRRQIDPENARLLLGLDLAHLGRVEVDLRVTNRTVDCRIDVEGEAQRDLFSEAQGDLRAGLEGCGYAVRRVACEVRPPAPDEGAPKEGQAKIGLDVRA